MLRTLVSASVLALATSANTPWECPEDPDTCLAGAKHKERPTREDSSYAACHEYREASCCTAEFTQQLAGSNVTEIRDGDDVFSWTKCGPLSQTCEAYLIEVECFYRCSPVLKSFEGAFPASLNRVPLCDHFCDRWFDACKDDLTCVSNWIFDWETVDNVNTCPEDNECTTFGSRFSGGQEMCEIMWGNSFNYTDGGEELCLTPTAAANNELVVEQIFAGCNDDEVGSAVTHGVGLAAAVVAVVGAACAAAVEA